MEGVRWATDNIFSCRPIDPSQTNNFDRSKTKGGHPDILIIH
jgi:hypothetical protein